MESTPTNIDYLQYFLKEKINNGEKQKDIAEFDPENLNTSFINRLYNKDKVKSVPIAKQQAIANYFGMTLDQVIEEGKIYYYNQHNRRSGSERVRANNGANKTENEDLVELLHHVANGIHRHDKELELFKSLMDQFDLGITIFDSRRNFVYSNYKGGFLEGLKIKSNDTIDTILVLTSDNIVNFKEVVEKVQQVKKTKPNSPVTIDVEFKDGQTSHFEIVSLYNKDNEHLGSVLITSIASQKPNTLLVAT